MNSVNTNMRLVGLASGLDTDTIVQQLMTAEKLPLNKLEKQRQQTEWKQEAYREFTNALRSFKEQFFDITKRASYLLSENSFKVYSAMSSSDEYVTARGTSLAIAGSHTVKVKQLATADKAVSTNTVSKPITGEVDSDYNLSGKTVKVTLDGVTREIELADYGDIDGLVTGLQASLNEAFGEGKITVSRNGDEFHLNTGGGATKLTLLSGNGLSSLGIKPGTSNRISLNGTLGELANILDTEMTYDESNNVSFEINGESFTFSKDATMQKVMSTINNSAKANVRMSYDEATDKFSITAKQMGAGDNIRINEAESSFFAAIGINSENPEITQGVDAIAEVDGVEITRSSNTFTVNGVEYTLKQEHTGDNFDTITLEQDVDSVYESIESFVEEYNKIVDMFNNKLSEKYDRNYQPLSEDEKAAMSEEQIEKWEERAKTGLLRNDPILEEIQRSMRMALGDTVDGVGMSLASIGISSNSYHDRGKLYIDENKLKEAIRERPDEVKNLFIKTSESVPAYNRDLTLTQRDKRYQEQGLLYRISDILDDNISTLRNEDGKKGVLLEKAGMVGDLSEFNSSLAEEINSFDERINEMYQKLIQKEESYYRQFTQLETYMNQMNSQMNWLTSQLGSLQ